MYVNDVNSKPQAYALLATINDFRLAEFIQRLGEREVMAILSESLQQLNKLDGLQIIIWRRW